MRSTSSPDAARQRPGLLRRLASIAYDILLIAALLMVLTGLAFALRGGNAFDPRSLWFRLMLLTACWAYFAWSWTSGGQTVGMRAWRLVLASRNGSAVGLPAATVRFLAGWLSTLPAGLGFLWSLIDRRGLTWHDRLSGTELALTPKLAQPDDGEQGDDE
jgi:uncharacterized RDD family membrane protein YckC